MKKSQLFIDEDLTRIVISIVSEFITNIMELRKLDVMLNANFIALDLIDRHHSIISRIFRKKFP